MAKQINKNMKISEIIDIDRRIGMILMQNGLPCVGCGAAQFETLEEAFGVHGMPPEKCDELVEGINNFLTRIEELEAKEATS